MSRWRARITSHDSTSEAQQRRRAKGRGNALPGHDQSARSGLGHQAESAPQAKFVQEWLAMASGYVPAMERVKDRERRERASYRILLKPALVAQRIEHLTTDQKVGGSSPSERAYVPAGQGSIWSCHRPREREAGPGFVTFLSHGLKPCHTAALWILPSAAAATARSSGRAWV